jgi:hypothetical protein
MSPQTSNASEHQPTPRYTGVCCRRCLEPVATLRGTGRDALVASCPACGYIRILAAPVRIGFDAVGSE